MANKKRNEWFEDTFLKSFEPKFTNPKYPNQCILTEAQNDICVRYMESHHSHNSDYNRFWAYYTYDVGGTHYLLTQRGRYYFLNRSFPPYRRHIVNRILARRWDRIEDRKYYGEEAYVKMYQ